MTPTVRSSGDAAVTLESVGPFLRARPIEHNLLLSLLTQRAEQPEEGRYWWALSAGEVAAFAFQSPTRFRGLLAAPDRECVEALAGVMAEEAPDLPGVMAEAATAASFAGHWAERRAVPVVPVEGQRLYRLGTVRRPVGVPGGLRRAGAGDRELLVAWAAAFAEETGGHPLAPSHIVDRHLATRGMWIWERDGEPVSVAAAAPPVAGVVRIGYVFTPPEHRRRGFAAACVAAVSERVQGEGAGCILYTQLQNPTSNAVYRRIGYQPVVEIVIYRFG